LTAIAVLDDLGAIVIIALFYTDSLSLPALLAAAALLAALFGLNRIGVARAWPFLLIGLVLWVAVLKSGVHATLAGVAVGFALPLNHRSGKRSPLIELEQRLHPWVAFGVLPLFAFANAGVPLRGLAPAIVFDPLPLGIALGLLLGKSLGIGGSIRLALRFGVAALPEGIERRTLPGLGLLCGIGFTMSLFIASLAFESSSGVLMLESRIGILLGSTVAALAGFLWLKWIYRRP
jgi:NhaA family Na+:H+ antiporter